MSRLICSKCGAAFEASKIDAVRMANNPLCASCQNKPAEPKRPETTPPGERYFKEPGIESTKDSPRRFNKGNRGSFGG